MSRRDTIIVAALVNAGLLIVLFVSALKNQDEGDQVVLQQKSSSLISNEVVALSTPKSVIGDEVDQVLKQYTQQDPLQVPIVIVPNSSASSFAEDLQGLTLPVSDPAPIVTKAVIEKEPALAFVEVKVKKGDMLEKLARQHHSSVAAIMKLNNLSSSQLKIGQVLKIAAASSAAAVVSVSSNATKSPQATLMDAVPSKLYTVKAGDSPWTIAVKNHMKVEDLLKLNNISEEKARRLKPGDQLRIR